MLSEGSRRDGKTVTEERRLCADRGKRERQKDSDRGEEAVLLTKGYGTDGEIVIEERRLYCLQRGTERW